jgi:hypothetical protein
LELRVENFDTRRGGWNFSLPEMMHPVQANFADKIELLGYDLPIRRVEAGGGIPLVLYWRSLTRMREDYTIFVQLLDANLERRGGYDRFPRETYNTYLWVPGEVVDDGFAVPVDLDASDGVYTIRIGLYRQEDGQAVPIPRMQDGQLLDETSVVIGPIKVGGAPTGVVVEEFAPEHPLNIALGDIMALRGYDLHREEALLRLQLYWQSLAQTDTDYTVFVHLRNGAGETVAQTDKPPADGKYPTLLWDQGDTVPDTFVINLSSDLGPGTYQLVVGLYDPMTGVRLSVPGTIDNSVSLTEINLN